MQKYQHQVQLLQKKVRKYVCHLSVLIDDRCSTQYPVRDIKRRNHEFTNSRI